LRALGAGADADAIPVEIRGPLRGGAVDLDASTSSQIVSGLLLAAPLMPGGLTTRHHGPPVPSTPHIAMTVAMLREAGVAVDDASPDRWQVSAGPVRAVDRRIEPDLSSASAFLAVAAATAGTVTIADWPAVTQQPGAALPGLLERMGCRIRLDTDGMHVTGPGRLLGVTADLRDAPELALTLAALGTLACSQSRLTGIAHLRLQESDRLGVLASELGRLGARIEVLPDGFAIEPAPLSAGAGVELDPHADHRLAMAYAVVGLAVPGVRVQDIATTDKTVPGFAGLWEQLVRG
jgi:3-phosphoshikimate 1-carboxyvinyltransferase